MKNININMKIPVEISARHIHLSQEDFEKLFGKSSQMSILSKISQPGQFAAKETLTISNGNNKIQNVRIVGPARKKSYAEISKTDAYKLKINPPVRVSGDLENTPKITVTNKNKKIKISVIISKRHLHVSEEQAKQLGLENKQIISIKTKGERGLIFDNVVVRAGPGNWLAFQLDTDEGNAAGIQGKTFGEIIRK